MEFRDYLIAGEQAAGGREELAAILKQQPNAITDAKIEGLGIDNACLKSEGEEEYGEALHDGVCSQNFPILTAEDQSMHEVFGIREIHSALCDPFGPGADRGTPSASVLRTGFAALLPPIACALRLLAVRLAPQSKWR